MLVRNSLVTNSRRLNSLSNNWTPKLGRSIRCSVNIYSPALHGKRQGSICHDDRWAYRPFIVSWYLLGGWYGSVVVSCYLFSWFEVPLRQSWGAQNKIVMKTEMKASNECLYPTDVFLISCGMGCKRITVSDIAYIEAMKDNCIIHMVDGKRYTQSCPMGDIEPELNPNQCNKIRWYTKLPFRIVTCFA